MESITCPAGHVVRLPTALPQTQIRCQTCGAVFTPEDARPRVIFAEEELPPSITDTRMMLVRRSVRYGSTTRPRIRKRQLVIGAILIGLGICLGLSEHDAPLLYMGTGTLIFLGIVISLKGLMGYKI